MKAIRGIYPVKKLDSKRDLRLDQGLPQRGGRREISTGGGTATGPYPER